jgi:DNA-binding NtrC family response regulator
LLAANTILLPMAHILICEEDEGIRGLLQRVIDLDGHTWSCIGGDDEFALEPDALLLDAWWSAAADCGRRARRRWPDLPIILTSNVVPLNAEIEDLRPFSRLSRPFAIDELRQVVAAALLPSSVPAQVVPLRASRRQA